MDLATALPNLGVGVAAVVVMFLMSRVITQIYVSRLKEKDQEFLAEIKEREVSFRTYEKEVRETTLKQLHETTRVVAENTKVMDRVVDLLQK